MKVLKNGLLLRLIILSLSLVVIAAALFVKQSKPPGKVAGTVTNPVLVANKFCDDPTNPLQKACTSFISTALAQTGNSTYQDVAGDVGISGNTRIVGTTSIGTTDTTDKLNVEGGYVGIRSGSGLHIYNTTNNAWSSINFDGTNTNFNWNVKINGQITSNADGGGTNWNAGALNLIDSSNDKAWQISNKGIGDPAGHNNLIILHRSDATNWVRPYAFILNPAGNLTITGCLNYNSSSIGTCASDIKVKKNINPFNLGLQEIVGLTPVTYQFNGLGDTTDDGKTKTGLIAQDVEKTAPQLVSTQQVKLRSNDVTTTEIKAVDYSALTFALINAVKAQQKEIEALQKEVEELKKK
ncbi:tail fiber domain-containing protein [Patescibacteria group bacterium]|nr:tail fiber domain-containing protein [Patescibacteria group bacterium]